MSDEHDRQAALLLLELWGSFTWDEPRREEGMNLLNDASFYLMHRATYPEPRNPPEGCR
jgi:hypothetical protein